jgi:hypothetical protein
MSLLPVGIGSEDAEYKIERSLRFNSADSAFLNRTPASASNRKTWTWSGWVKLGSSFDTRRMLFGGGLAGGGSIPNTYIEIGDSDDSGGNTFRIDQVAPSTYELQMRVATSALLRDPSAWYHLVVAIDTTQATNTNRVKMYINGVQQTSFFSTTYPSQNLDTGVNTTTSHKIGVYPESGVATLYYDGYMTEINFIDGQALTPSSFGEINADTGVWQPIEYTGTYGTNGFYLNFSDNASTTTLGDDFSGNGNDWTLNNFSVTAGAGNDSLVDSPQRYGIDTGAGGEVRGNYATLNPLDIPSSTSTSDGNLVFTTSATNTWKSVTSTIAVSSGKYYCEFIFNGTYAMFGVVRSSWNANIADSRFWQDSAGYSYFSDGGEKYSNGSSSAYGASFTTTDVIGVALDLDAGTLVFYKNGVSQGTAFSGLSGKIKFSAAVYGSSGDTLTANFGQRPFAYTAPSGFKALVTTNLPTPAIEKGGEYFNTVLYTGTGSSQSITGVGFQPDWVWIKERNAAVDHGLYDAVRGVQNQLESNTTTAETVESTGLTAFGTDGFTVGALAQLNTSTDTYVAWNWKANGAGVSNTDGTITSTVSVSTTSGFSIVTYTGTGAAATVGHGLGAVSRMIIVKNRDAADAWQVYHAANTANPETDYLVLNTTAATADNANRWNDTLPTSTVFSIGDGVEVNTNTEDYVAYCFAEVEGFSKFGSYTGNGDANGPMIFTGFAPAYVFVKRTDTTSQWNTWDNKRKTYNVNGTNLWLDAADAEITNDALYGIDLLSNGFKLRNTHVGRNASGGTYIYACFAENPFAYSLAR